MQRSDLFYAQKETTLSIPGALCQAARFMPGAADISHTILGKVTVSGGSDSSSFSFPPFWEQNSAKGLSEEERCPIESGIGSNWLQATSMTLRYFLGTQNLNPSSCPPKGFLLVWDQTVYEMKSKPLLDFHCAPSPGHKGIWASSKQGS